MKLALGCLVFTDIYYAQDIYNIVVDSCFYSVCRDWLTTLYVLILILTTLVQTTTLQFL